MSMLGPVTCSALTVTAPVFPLGELLLTPSGTWAISITYRSGWLSLSGLSSASSTTFRGHSWHFSITYGSFNPSPTLTVLTTFPGMVVRRLYRQAGAFVTR